MKSAKGRYGLSFLVGLSVAVLSNAVAAFFPGLGGMAGGITVFGLSAVIAGIWSAASLLSLITLAVLERKGQPESEGMMIGRLYRLLSIVVILLALAYGFGKLGTFGTLFSLFGGMILGWSLQAPVSGFAAWVLVSIKRPFRPGDRVQFPNLGLTGDVMDIGPMYVTLDQVGGTVGSEDAVGRFILVPNAMLFSQVVINFTVKQEAAYMLDEVVVRITYDSDMDKAETILIDAARAITGDIITATGVEPYIRSDWYDYGIYLRLRYQTKAKDRPKIAYEINKAIFKTIQRTPSVDLAIPFIYSFRSGLADMEHKEEHAAKDAAKDSDNDIEQIPAHKIRNPSATGDPRDVEQLSRSIAVAGLLQPIIVIQVPGEDSYEVVAGGLRLAACIHLGWKSVPCVVRHTVSGINKKSPPKPAIDGEDPKSLCVP